MNAERKNATGYVSDDHQTIEVIVAYCMQKGWMVHHDCPDHPEGHYEWDYESSEKYIKQGIDEGIFKLHLELGEFYYHATVAGLELLKCKSCESELFTEKELQTRGFDPCQV